MIEEEKLYVDVHRRRLSFIIIIYISIIYLFICLFNEYITDISIRNTRKNACIYDYILIFLFSFCT